MDKEIMWEDYIDERFGIFNAGYEVEDHGDYGKIYRNFGYNNISKGDTVEYDGEYYKVVMVSRMGDFGLSNTGALPYTIRVVPSKCVKLSDKK